MALDWWLDFKKIYEKQIFSIFSWFFISSNCTNFAILYSLSQKKGLNKLLKIVQNIKLEKKLNQILVRPKTGMGKIEKFKNTFFPYFLWVFLLLTANKSVKFVLKSKIKNTSNHQNFMSMESKNRWHLTGGWVLRKFVKRNFLYFLWFF